MSGLDERERIRAIDAGSMYEAIQSFPDQIRKAPDLFDSDKIKPENFKKPNAIVVCGMGGSAIGGDLARSYLAPKLAIPMVICRDYRLPSWVDEHALVIGSSYSGNTEETLEAFGEAIERKAQLLALTTGGELKARSAKHGIPVIDLPEGLQPRAALGYSFAPLLLFLSALGIGSTGADELSRLAAFLEENGSSYDIESETDANEAKRLALRLYGRIPIIYSGPELTDAAALRWKGQICENAKMLAFANQFPEFNHNELVGWQKAEHLKDILRVIYLRDRADHARIAARMDIVKEAVEKQKTDVIEVTSSGQSRLERLFSLIQLGDYISFYLAVLNNVDPTPVEPIEKLKAALAEMK
jgi:glucose/mannose-6-phosphate isomerase